MKTVFINDSNPFINEFEYEFVGKVVLSIINHTTNFSNPAIVTKRKI